MNGTKKLYDVLTQRGVNIGDYNQFETAMRDPRRREKLYDALNTRGFNVGTYEQFDGLFTDKKQRGRTEPDGGGMEPMGIPMKFEPQKAQKPYKSSWGLPRLRGGSNIAESNIRQMQELEQAQREEYEHSAFKARKDAEDRLRAYIRSRNKEEEEAERWHREHPFLSALYDIGASANADKLSGDMNYNPLLEARNLAVGKTRETKRRQNIERQLNEAANTRREATNNHDGAVAFGRGFGRQIVNPYNWDGGAADLDYQTQLLEISNKMQRGETLSEGEQALMDATAINNQVQADLGDKVSSWYKLGEMTAQNVPFMVEFALTGGGRAAITKGTQKFLQRYLGKSALSRVTSRLAGDVAATAVLTSTADQMKVMAGATRRMRGEVRPMENEKGEIVSAGFTEGEGLLEAYGKAYARQFIENWSEVAGEYFAPVIGAVGRTGLNVVSRGGRKMLTPEAWRKVSKGLRAFREGIGKSGFARAVKDYEKKAQWHGIIGEFGEEVLGSTMDALIVRDESLADVYSAKQLEETFISLAPMSVFFAGVSTAGYRTQHYRLSKALEKASTDIDSALGDKGAAYRESYADASDEERRRMFHAALSEAGSPAKRKAIVDYTLAHERMNAYNEQKVTEALTGERHPSEQRGEESYGEGVDTYTESGSDETKAELEQAVAKAREKMPYELRREAERIYDMHSAELMIEYLSGMEPDEAVAVQAWVDAKAKLEGYKDAETNTAVDGAEEEGRAAKEPADIHQAQREMDAATARLRENGPLYDALQSYLTDGASREEINTFVNGLSAEDAEVCRAYLAARARMDGVREGMKDDIEQESRTFAGEMAPAVRDGKITVGRDKNGRNVYLVPPPEGGMWMKVEDGRLVSASIEDYTDVQTYDAAEFESKGREEIRRRAEERVAKNTEHHPMTHEPAKGEIVYNGGTAYMVDYDDEGTPTLQLAEKDGEGWKPVTGTPVPVSMDEILDMMDKYYDAIDDAKRQQNMEGQGESLASERQAMEAQQPQQPKKLTQEETLALIEDMERNAVPAPEIKLTIENWDALFGTDGVVNTPIGNVKMGENQFTKLMRKGREGKLGMVKPTLETPFVIIETESEAKEGEKTERNSSYVFVKAFVKPDGTRYYYFTSVTVKKEDKEVIVSNQEKSRNRLLRLLTEGDVVWRTPKDATTPSAEGQGLDYAQSSKAETATKGSVLTPQSTSSAGKVTQGVGNEQGNTDVSEQKTPEERWKKEVEEMGEEYARKYVDSSIASLEEAIRKARKQEPKAGSTPEKIKEFLLNQRNKIAEMERQLEEFRQMKGVMNADVRHVVRDVQPKAKESEYSIMKRKYVDDAEVMEILNADEPQTVDEVIATMLASGVKIMGKSEDVNGVHYDGYQAHTGYGTEEQKRLAWYIRTRAKGGVSFDRFVEMVESRAVEYGVDVTGEDVTTELLNFFQQLRGSVKEYIHDKRVAQAQEYIAQREAAEEADARKYFFEDTHFTPEEYELWQQYMEQVAEERAEEFNSQELRDIFAESYELIKQNNGRTNSIHEGVSEGQGVQQGSEGSVQVDEGEQAATGTSNQEGGADEGLQPAGKTGNGGLHEASDGAGPVGQAVAQAEQETDVNPTDGQKEAGNYKKGHVSIDGFDITIENPKGSVRSGKDASGKEWSVTMNNTYGYIRGTEGVDGDHIDVFLSDNLDGWNGSVYVVDQVNEDGSFDEHKVMYGFNSADEAATAYNSNYSEGWQGLGTITAVSGENFKKWVNSSHRKTKPFAEYKTVDKEVEAKKVESTENGAQLAIPFGETTADEKQKNVDNLHTSFYKLYQDYKKKYPDVRLLFRTGDFYEVLDEDATAASKILGLKITQLSNIEGADGKALKMAGFPYHALDTYLPKLIRAGERVAIMDQLEDPKTKKNIKRGVQPITENASEASAPKKKELHKRKENSNFTPAEKKTTNEGDITEAASEGKPEVKQDIGLKSVGASPAPTVKKQSGGRSVSSSEKKIDDWGEKIAGARKDMLADIAKTLDNVTAQSLVQQPLSKAFKRPDLKKLTETGALTEKEALAAEAIMAALCPAQKPKAGTKEMKRAMRYYGRDLMAEWAEKAAEGIETLNRYLKATPEEREKILEEITAEDTVQRAAETAETIRLRELNPDHDIPDVHAPNPVKFALDVLESIGYEPGQKIGELPKVEVQFGRLQLLNEKGGELVRVNTVEEAREKAAFMVMLREGMSGLQIPVREIGIGARRREQSEEIVAWAVRYYRSSRLTDLAEERFDTREEAEKRLEELKTRKGRVKDAVIAEIHGYTPTDYTFYVRDEYTNEYIEPEGERGYKFATRDEAQAYLEEHYDEVNERLVARNAEMKNKQQEKQDSLYVAMTYGEKGRRYSIICKEPFMNKLPGIFGGWMPLKDFDTREEAEKYLAEHREEVYAPIAEMKEKMKNFVYFGPDRPRVGEDWRGGRDVTEQELGETFGFRGVQFGNWTNDKDRQKAVNEAYDALKDLAHALGISDKAIGLNGELGIAFGARGTGSASAHYEPQEVVINLTKTHGAGALAHEWLHALDNYFSRAGGDPAAMVTATKVTNGMRPELREAWNELMDAVHKSNYYTRSVKKGRQYWGTDWEVAARLFAEWINDKLEAKGKHNSFLSRGVDQTVFDNYLNFTYLMYETSQRRKRNWKGEPLEVMSKEEFAKTPAALGDMPYPTKEETKALAPLIEKLFGTMEEETRREGTVALYSRGMGEPGTEVETEIDKTATEFVMDAAERNRKVGVNTYVLTEEQAEMELARIEEAKRRAEAGNDVFYSNAMNAIKSVRQEKATGEQWLRMLEKAGGIKAGEDKWTGLSDYLNQNSDKTLTREDVMRYIRENSIKVEEVEYTEKPKNPYFDIEYGDFEFSDKMFEELERRYGLTYQDGQHGYEYLPNESFEFLGDADERLENARKVNNNAHFVDESRYDLTEEEDRENFVNDVATELMHEIDDWAVNNYEDSSDEKSINDTRLEFTTEGLENKKEIVLTVPTIEPWQKEDKIHFGEAGEGRAVAWVRFGETTDADGHRVLVIDEIQSNRHQEGREKGYKPIVSEKQKQEYAVAQKLHRAAIKAFNDYKKELEEKYGEYRQFVRAEDLFVEGDSALERWMSNFTAEERDEYNRLKKEMSETSDTVIGLENKMETSSYDRRVPQAPFDKNWHELAMKRMLRYAAENGYDKVAWTKGEQQTERYGLGGVVDRITKGKTRGEKTLVEVTYKNGKRDSWVVDTSGKVIEGGITNGEFLSDLIGKELSQKVMSINEGESLEGDNLRIGGEGMKGFYDQMLPRFMDKYGKKWNVKTGETELPELEESARRMWSVDVTPEMKESVMEGQPMFSMRVYHGSGADFDRFDHSHMGEGEGAQAFGWGTYVTEVEGIGRTYAKAVTRKPVGSRPVMYKGENIKDVDQTGWSDAKKEVFRELVDLQTGQGKSAFNANDYLKMRLDVDVYQSERGLRRSQISEEGWTAAVRYIESLTDDEYRKLIDNDEWRNLSGDLKYLKYAINENRDLGRGGILLICEQRVDEAKHNQKFYADRKKSAEEQLACLSEFSSTDFTRKKYEPIVYTVGIPEDNGRRYLDYNVEMEQQPNLLDAIGEGLEKRGWKRNGMTWSNDVHKVGFELASYKKGSQVYEALAKMMGSQKMASDFLRSVGIIGIKYPSQFLSGGREDGTKNYVIFDEDDLKIEDKVRMLRDSKGVVYGWTKGGAIYLTPRGVNPNTPVHEYAGHVWGPAVRKNNPELWKRFKDLAKESPIWEEILQEDAYSDIWGSDDLMAEEVIGRGSGRRNAERLKAKIEEWVKSEPDLMKKAEKASLWHRLREALAAVKRWIAEHVFQMKPEQFETIDDVFDKSISDFYNEVDLGLRGDTTEDGVRFSRVDDADLLRKLEKGKTVKRYRAMQIIDGKLYPPMSAKVDGELREPTEIGVWEQSEERPDLIDPKTGKFKLNKGQKGQSGVPAAYNPYFHTSTSGLNDQFTSAYKRPELVTVEVEVPESELSSGYKAEFAKDAVGDTDWHSGPVNAALPKDRQRTVTLSRYSKVTRIVPDGEVADMVAAQLKDTGVEVPYNVVTPSLRRELEKRGVKISATPSGTVTEDINGNKVSGSEKPNGKGGIGTDDTGGLTEGQIKVMEMRYPNMSREEIVSKFGNGIGQSELSEDEARDVEKKAAVFRKGHKGAGRVMVVRDRVHYEILLDMLGLDDDIIESELRKYDTIQRGGANFPQMGVTFLFTEGSQEQINSYLCHETAHQGLEAIYGEDKDFHIGRLYDAIASRGLYEKTIAQVREKYQDRSEAEQREECIVAIITNMYERNDASADDFLKGVGRVELDEDRLLYNVFNYIFNGEQGEEIRLREVREGTGREGESVPLRNSGRPGHRGGDETPGRGEEVRDSIASREEEIAEQNGFASKDYDRRLSEASFRMQESWQDSMLGLKVLQDEIAKQTGSKIRDFENAYMAENALSSVNFAEMEAYKQLLYRPLLQEIAALEKEGMSYDEVKTYLIAKHGLERNKVLAKRDALRDAPAKIEEFRRDLKSERNKVLTEMRTIKRQFAAEEISEGEYSAKMFELETQRVKIDRIMESDESLREYVEGALEQEYRKKDYSGLTALFAEREEMKDILNRQEEALAEAAQLRKEGDRFGSSEKRSEAKEMEVELHETAEELARRTVDEEESAHDFGGLWKRINAATKATLEKMRESGLMSDEDAEAMAGMFEWYIPLRGFDETTSDEVYDYLRGERGPANSPIKKAMGRRSLADDPIATIGNIAESGIVEGNRNLMKQKFLLMAEGHPTDLISISQGVWMRLNDVTGEWEAVSAEIPDNADGQEVKRAVEEFEARMSYLAEVEPERYRSSREWPHIPYRVIDGNLSEHQVRVKRGGREYILTVNGNPRAAQAINGFTNPHASTNKIVRNLEAANRFLSANFTSRNPAFILANLSRDGIYANSTVWVKEGAAYAWQYNRNWSKALLHMAGLVSRYKADKLDMSNYLDRMFHMFIMNGGETGYTAMSNLDEYKDMIKKELDHYRKKGVVRSTVRLIGESLDTFNRWAEGTSRFAAFLTSMENGRSTARSISDAKEISVNFNKKGAGNATEDTFQSNAAQFCRGLYIFWNAGVQGMTNFIRLARKNGRKFTTLAAGFYLGGALQPLVCQAMMMLLGGDPDDYWNLPEYVRRSNICIWAGGRWIKIPLPIELRSLWGLGELTSGMLLGKTHYSARKATVKMAEQVCQILPLDPTEGNGGWSTFIPSYGKPLYEAYGSNTDWTGIPIYKENDFNRNMPEWTKAYKGTTPELVALAEALNEATGGNKYRKGIVDINPARVEHLLSGYLGGIGTTAMQGWKTVNMAWDADMRDVRNVPVINRFLSSGDERARQKNIRERYFDHKREMDEIGQEIDGFMRDVKNPALSPAERGEAMTHINDIIYTNGRREISPEYRRYLVWKEMDKGLQKFRKVKDLMPETMEEYYYGYMDDMNKVAEGK